jgi:hypothetical protein
LAGAPWPVAPNVSARAEFLDSSKAGLPGATITVTNTATNAQRVTQADSEGRFAVPNLRPGNYSLKIELAGFQTAEVKDFTLRNSEIARPTFTLGIATLSETVSVQAESPLLQKTNASVTQTINQKQIEDLPVAGRNPLAFASLSAGVTPQAFNRGTQFGATGSSRSQYVTVEGGRDSSTNYAIDGVYVRSLRFNNLSINPPLDAVQELNVLRNSFTTEYGQGQAVVSMVTKSGGNNITASAYTYRRDDSLNSANFFGQKPGDKTQAGFTGGGPIIKNKFFAFGGYEGLRTTADRTLLGSVPNPVLLSGDFSLLGTPIMDPLTGAPFPGNIIPADRFSNFANVLGPTIPDPNLVGANNLRVVKSFNDDADTADVRLDQVLSSKHSLFERYLYYNGRQTNPSLFSFTDFPQRGQNLAVGETWVMSPGIVNETRVGYNHAYHLNAPISLDGRNWVADIGLQNLAWRRSNRLWTSLALP